MTIHLIIPFKGSFDVFLEKFVKVIYEIRFGN